MGLLAGHLIFRRYWRGTDRFKLFFRPRPCPPDNCLRCFTLHTRVSCQPSEPSRPVHRCLFFEAVLLKSGGLPLASLPVTDLSGRLETKNMHVCIYSQCTNAFIYALSLRKCMEIGRASCRERV